MKEFRKRYWYEIALCASFIQLIYSPIAYTAEVDEADLQESLLSISPPESWEELSTQDEKPEEKVIARAPEQWDELAARVGEDGNSDTYTINFNNIAITQLIRFASKITNLNFVFEEADLQFAVTVVSEEPVSAKSFMAALSQVLRTHSLVLLEQNGNVLITKSTTVNQIPPIISSDLPESQSSNAALVTRVFRIKNANVNTLAGIIRPMTSQGALIEVSVETRQLIVTDIATNVDQIASLLVSLDAPHSPLDVETYVVKNIAPSELISLTQQILNPFTEGNPLLFVPQLDTNSIYIVSTPYLIERAMTVMEDLDIPSKPVVVGKMGVQGKNVFLYKPINLTTSELISELGLIADRLKNAGGAPSSLQLALESVQEVDETGSLIFLADAATVTQIKDILTSLDSPSTGKTSFYIYKIQRAQEQQIAESLKQMQERLQSSPHPDQELITAIESMKWIKETNSLVFTGAEAALKKLAEILPTFDVNPSQARSWAQAQAKSTFLVYTPQYRSGEELSGEIQELGKNLQQSGLADPSFLETIETMRWVPTTNSLVFTGDPQSIERIQAILKSMDSATAYVSKTAQVFIYKPQFASPDQIQNALTSLIPSLQGTRTQADQNLVTTIQAMRWNADTQSFIFTADPATIERLKILLESIDSAQQGAGPIAKGFFLYKLQHAQCDVVLEEIKNIAKKMPVSSLQNQNLIAAIGRIECIKSNNSLLITGTSDAIEQIKTLIVEFDVPSGTPVPTGAQSFLIYKPKYLPAQEIEAALNDLAKDLEESGLKDPQLFQTLDTMRYVAQTGSLLFTGTQEGLDKVQNLLNGIDTSAAVGAIQSIGNLTFLIYKVQYASSDKLISSLKAFAVDLKQSNVQDKQLAEAINNVKWIKETNSLLFTGTTQALEKVEQLVKKFDVPSMAGPQPVERAASNFVLYNPKYLTGDELISILCDFMQNLMSSGVSDPGLFDTISNLRWIDKTSSLLISGDPQSVEKVQQLLARFDVPGKENIAPSIESIDNTSFLVYKLNFHPGNDIQSALKQVAVSLGKGSTPPTALVEAINSLQWIQVTNSLLCTGQQDVLVKLKELIQNIDVPLRQVFIEVLVIETTLNNTQNFGLMWGSQLKYMNKTILQTGNFPLPASQGSSTPSTTFPQNLQAINATTTPTNTNIPFSSGFDLGVIGDIIMHKGKSFLSLGSLMNALQLDTDSTILLNPKIVTQDNRQSIIFIGQNIPYTGALVTNNAAQITQTANIEYRDVGVSLTITPILGDGDVITMDIVHDISELVNGTNVTTSNQQLTGIQTNHTHMETRVHVPNNHFVALSGMIDESRTHYRTAIPCLGGLPVIGLLFSENDRVAEKNNIIIFVRPQIIDSYRDFKAITEHQEWLYKNNASIPVLREEFDQGIDMVKLPENE